MILGKVLYEMEIKERRKKVDEMVSENEVEKSYDRKKEKCAKIKVSNSSKNFIDDD